MPTYDYACTRCNHTFEHFQSITSDPLKKCPECGKPSLQRLMGTGGGVIFKGSGFYQTDYRSESYKKAAEGESKPASSDASAGESKPAKKSDGPGKSDAGTAKPAAAPDRGAAKRTKGGD